MMPKPSRRTAGWLTASILATLAVLVLAQSAAALPPRRPPPAAILPTGAIAPTDNQKATARKVGRILEEAHYSRAPIDKKMSEQVFNRYLDFLDGQHSYFLASDITEFQAYKFKFDDMIRTGDVEPAYAIFARFQQRNRERIQHAIGFLAKEPDWTVNETFDFERQKAAWPASETEINELWRKRVKNDALSLMLTGKQWPEVTDLLKKRYERVLKRVDQVTPEDVFENLMNAYARSFDPHSSYFSPRNSEEYRIQMSLNYEGIGPSLRLVNNSVATMNVMEGAPAAVAATLNTNDRITGV